MKKLFLIFFAQVLVVCHAVAAVSPEWRVERMQFSKGATSSVIKGKLHGREYVDYQVHAGAGQLLEVALRATNPQNYFNINPPATEVSMFVGSSSGNQFKAQVPGDGVYTIRVYLMRPAARRGETSRYTLDVSLSGKALPALPASKDALIPGTLYHASAKVDCVPAFTSQAEQCEAFVIRRSHDGTATVEAKSKAGQKRRILFVKGKPLASDAVEPMAHTRKGDLNIVRFGTDERYEIPDALLTGG